MPGIPLPSGLVVKNPLQYRRCRRHGFDPWVGRSPGGGHGNPLQYSCLENPTDRGAWQATVHGVTQSQTRLSTHGTIGTSNTASPGPVPTLYPPGYLCIHTFIICLITWHGLSPRIGSEFLKGNPISFFYLKKIQYENRNHLKYFKLTVTQHSQSHGKTSPHWTFDFRIFLSWLSVEVWKLLTCSWQPHIQEDDGQMVECGMWPRNTPRTGQHDSHQEG